MFILQASGPLRSGPSGPGSGYSVMPKHWNIELGALLAHARPKEKYHKSKVSNLIGLSLTKWSLKNLEQLAILLLDF